jgi:class 3 adenylate cyclase
VATEEDGPLGTTWARRDHEHVPELLSGTVTLLFTDIEGSTRLLHELKERYANVLAEHRRVLREAFSRHGGVEVDRQGTRSSSRSRGPAMRSPPREMLRMRSQADLCACGSVSTPASQS